MDFVRLGERYSTDYLPTDLIEGYNSLIWTERFQAPGEFELKSFNVDGLSKLLPEDTLVSHLETREVMQVETHEINMVGEGADARPEIAIRGRSAISILDHRWIEAPYQKKRRMRKKYTASGALSVLLYNAVDNGSGKDVTRGDDDPEISGKNDYSWPEHERITAIAVTETVSARGENRWWQLEQGILWEQFQQIMIDADLGLRMIRPVDKLTPGTVITVKTALDERGTIVRTDNPDIRALQFNVYQGVDRTSGEGSVKFSLLQGHLDKPTYLTSKALYKTFVEVMSGEINVKDVTREGEGELAGWKRRVMGFDAGSPELPDEPKEPKKPKSNATKAEKTAYDKAYDKWVDDHAHWANKRDTIVDDFREEATKLAGRELKKARRVNMFSGDVSSLSPYIYKTHYDLGDTVLLVGDYDKTAEMVVAEYVRTEDANGDRGFPGLVES